MNQRYPRGLYPLFFTELWERFGFYAVQTILVLYMSRGMGLSDNQSYLLYGTFSSMLYLTPVLGGYLADQILGFRRAVILGAILFIIGYAVMAVRSHYALFLGMSIVILACGLFKANVSSMVGDLYETNDSRRDSGFTLFYMGINIGSLLPPLFAGPLVARFGWHSGFFVASVGLVIGLITFLSFKKSLGHVGDVPSFSPLKKGPREQFQVYSLMALGFVVCIGLLHLLFHFPQETLFVLIGVTLIILARVFTRLFKESLPQRKKLFACLILILISVGFWAVYMQTYTSLMLFADRNMSKQFLWFTIDAEFTQFFNPFFIILLSPILSSYWFWLGKNKNDPSTPVKFSCGLLMMTLGFILLGSVVRFCSVDGLLSPWWLCACYFLMTMGELLLSPIGLSMVTTLAPKHLRGTMMGIWFLSISAAFAMGGGLATWASVPAGLPLVDSSLIYSTAFFKYGMLSLAVTLISFACVPYVKRLIEPPEDLVKTPK
jgi:POT family proton-dependent oligopeptide transporter